MSGAASSTCGVHQGIAAAIALILGAVCPTIAGAAPPERYEVADLKALEAAFVELAEQVRPSVVAVRTYRLSDRERPGAKSILLPFGQGSGFVVSADGYLATNAHVVAGADVVSVILHNGLKHEATVVQADARSDLAVLKVDVQDLKAVRFGDVANVKVNQWAFACGNPFGLANDDGQTSVTYGVVSALNRQLTNRLASGSNVQYYGNLIETSAAINPGSSGGPLFNLDGEVVGVVTAIETTTGVSDGHGFAIPIDKNIRRILDTLKDGQAVRYGFLGVTVKDVEAPPAVVGNLRAHRGAEVDSIGFANGPAAQAGLKTKDVVIEYDDMSVENADHLVRLVGFTPVGTQVSITFMRDGAKRKAAVTIGDRQEMLSRAEPPK
jgi:serine protease Do